ncbi:MAG: hypothetical protein ACFCD0_21295 [Gemmataceae bacterium]
MQNRIIIAVVGLLFWISTSYAQGLSQLEDSELPIIPVVHSTQPTQEATKGKHWETVSIQGTQETIPYPKTEGNQLPTLPNTPQHQQLPNGPQTEFKSTIPQQPAPVSTTAPTMIHQPGYPPSACAATNAIQHAIFHCKCDACRDCRVGRSCGHARGNKWKRLWRWATYFPGRAYCPKYHPECRPYCPPPNYAFWYHKRCQRCSPGCHENCQNCGTTAPVSQTNPPPFAPSTTNIPVTSSMDVPSPVYDSPRH